MSRWLQARRRRCRHENVDHLAAGEGWALMDGTPMPDALVEQLRCLDCGAVLSLGPANDAPAEVQVEIRAARLADACVRVNQPPEWLEYDGWQAHAYSTDFYSGEPIQHRRHFDAGYLARVIATHDATHEHEGGE